MQVIDARDRYLDDVTSNYTLLAPNNVAIQKMLNFSSSDFWKDDSNVFTFFRCISFFLQFLQSVLFCLIVLCYFMLWAVVSTVAAFLTLGTHVFIVHTVFLYSLTVCVSKIN